MSAKTRSLRKPLIQCCELRHAVGIEVADRNRHGPREEQVLFRDRSRRRILAEEPAREPLRILQAHAAMAEIAVVLSEEFLPRRIVKIDSVAVRKVELEAAQGIGRPWQFANIYLRGAFGDRFPVYAVRRNHTSVGREGGDNFIAMLREIGGALLQNVRSDERPGEIGRQVPIRLQRFVSYGILDLDVLLIR